MTELNQVARLAVHVRPSIDNHRSFAQARNNHQYGGAGDMRQRPQGKHAHSHHRTGITGADDGIDLTGFGLP